MVAQSYQREAGWGGREPAAQKPARPSFPHLHGNQAWLIRTRQNHLLYDGTLIALSCSLPTPTILHILILPTNPKKKSWQATPHSPLQTFFIQFGGSFLLRRCPGNLIQTEYKGTWKGWIGQRAEGNNEVCPYSGRAERSPRSHLTASPNVK